MAAYNGWTEHVPVKIIPWFVIYQILGVLFFSSIFIAIGSAVKQLKEAQSLLLPVWMLMFLPMFVWFNVIEEPNSVVAVALSFFPPSAPLMTVLRLATGAAIPIWQLDIGRIAHIRQLQYPKELPSYGDRVGFMPDVWWYQPD